MVRVMVGLFGPWHNEKETKIRQLHFIIVVTQRTTRLLKGFWVTGTA